MHIRKVTQLKSKKQNKKTIITIYSNRLPKGAETKPTEASASSPAPPGFGDEQQSLALHDGASAKEAEVGEGDAEAQSWEKSMVGLLRGEKCFSLFFRVF